MHLKTHVEISIPAMRAIQWHLADIFTAIKMKHFDPLGHDYMMYTFENRCIEVENLKYEDGLKFIYFYTGGTKGGNTKIKTMLQYLQHSTANNAMDESTKELHDYVSKVKVSPEIREEYMRFEELIAFERRDAIVQDILSLLEDYGEVPDALKEKLSQTHSEILKIYLKLSAKADSLEEFMKILE